MNLATVLAAILFGGFFAVACLRASVPAAPDQRLRPGDLFRLPGRLERLRRSRWQWCSMVLVLLLMRLQQGLPLVLEATILLQFLVFLALPTAAREGKARVH